MAPEPNPDLQQLGRRLVGSWTTDGTHPALSGDEIRGSGDAEWLDGERFLILRTHYEHPQMPDAISLIGDGDGAGLQMHYFDSRGVRRLFQLSVDDERWRILMDRTAPTGSFATEDATFSQRATYAFEDADTMTCRVQISRDDVSWENDLEITYRRMS